MSRSQTMSVRSRWLTFVMHLTATIAERKQDLTKYHAIRTFFDIVTIILLEGVLAIVSIPLYFSTSSASLSPENDFNIQYVIRKTLTFAIFFLLFAIFILKVFVIGTLVVDQFQQQPQIQNVALPGPSIVNFLSALIDQKLAPPLINGLNASDQKNFEIYGTAEPSSTVILTVLQKENPTSQPAMQMYSTMTDINGNWDIHSSSLFAIEPGNYSFQAQMFDSKLQEKSPFGNTVEYNLAASPSENFMKVLDNIADILLFSFIGIGFLVIFLTF